LRPASGLGIGFAGVAGTRRGAASAAGRTVLALTTTSTAAAGTSAAGRLGRDEGIPNLLLQIQVANADLLASAHTFRADDDVEILEL